MSNIRVDRAWSVCDPSKIEVADHIILISAEHLQDTRYIIIKFKSYLKSM